MRSSPGEAARVITTESGRLERLVRDLLDLARMNRTEFSVRTEAVDLAEIAREAARRHEPTARGLGVELARRRRRSRGSRATRTGCCRSRRTSSRTHCARRRREAR